MLLHCAKCAHAKFVRIALFLQLFSVALDPRETARVMFVVRDAFFDYAIAQLRAPSMNKPSCRLAQRALHRAAREFA